MSFVRDLMMAVECSLKLGFWSATGSQNLQFTQTGILSPEHTNEVEFPGSTCPLSRTALYQLIDAKTLLLITGLFAEHFTYISSLHPQTALGSRY